MFKKRFLLVGMTVPLLALSGCTIGEENVEEKTISIEKVDMSIYEDQLTTGNYEGILNKRFIDINVDGKLKTLHMNDETLGKFEQIAGDLKKDDVLVFEYALNKETYQEELTSIIQVNGKDVAFEVKKPEKDNLIPQEVSNTKKIKMEVDYLSGTKIVETVEEEYLTGKIKVIVPYEWDGTKLSSPNTEIEFHIVKDTIEDDMQKERWRAASILEGIGRLEEIKESNLEDTEFVFRAESEKEFKEIAVVKNKYGYMRVELKTTFDNKENAIAERDAMVQTMN